LAGLTLVILATTAGLAQADPLVFPPTSRPYGMTYEQWSARWWQWALATPRPTNPLLDTTGANCGVGQSGPVWFLAGTWGSGSVARSCTVPAGKALFFPVMSAVYVQETPDVSYEGQLAFAKAAMKGARGAAAIDATQMQNLEQEYRFSSPSFSIQLPDDSLFNGPSVVPAGTYEPAAAYGIYLMVAPLSSGAHAINFQGSAQGTPDKTGPLSVKAKYSLTVAAP
jgi:hypothetical protein